LKEQTEINGRGDSLRSPGDTLYPLKLALTSSTSGGRSVDIVRWRTKAPEFFCLNIPTMRVVYVHAYTHSMRLRGSWLKHLLFHSLSLVCIIIIIINCKWVFTRWQWYNNKTTDK
jgi:hypothetical protein